MSDETKPKSHEPGGTDYRVDVLVPMQERHWSIQKFMMWSGLTVATLCVVGTVHSEYAGIGMAITVLAVIVPMAISKCMDAKRAKLSEQHRELVRKHGTVEKQWRPSMSYADMSRTIG